MYNYIKRSSKDVIADVDGNDTVLFFFCTFVIGTKVSPGHARFNASPCGTQRGQEGNDTGEQRYLQIVPCVKRTHTTSADRTPVTGILWAYTSIL